MSVSLDLDRLLRLRLVVARVGEMDLARWWNCQDVLGQLGAHAYGREFPSIHPFARARVAFTVERTSPAVKAALHDLLTAPTPAAGRGGSRRARAAR